MGWNNKDNSRYKWNWKQPMRKLIKMVNAYAVSFRKMGPIPKLDSAYCCTLLQCP